MQMEHACELLLQSELFAFHSERMCDNIVDKVQKVCKEFPTKKLNRDLIDHDQTTDPHLRLILYNVLLFYGRNKTNFHRTHKRLQPLIPLLIENISVDLDPGVQDTYPDANASGLHWSRSVVIPMEAKPRTLSVRLLYEICRVQKFAYGDLGKSFQVFPAVNAHSCIWTEIYKDSFVDYLFDLVEQTRDMEDETFNYSVIKLIVSPRIPPILACLNVLAGRPERTIYGSTASRQNIQQGQGWGG